MIGIDQNCTPLWDVPAKLSAMARRGKTVTQFIEDIDIAFTSVDDQAAHLPPRIAKERFYKTGQQDWGATLFYSDFLGKLPADIRRWQTSIGMKFSTLARKLSRSEQDLYDEFSPGDNHQLIGTSLVDERNHRRIIADLSVTDAADPLRETMKIARENMLDTFCESAAKQRIKQWFSQESDFLDGKIRQLSSARLIDIYREWLKRHVPASVKIDLTSNLFSVKNPAGLELANIFTSNYALATDLYNRAIDQTDTGLKRMDKSAGELPFFAVRQHLGHLVRANLALDKKTIRIGDIAIPLDENGRMPPRELARAGVRCICGRAIVMVLQVSICEHLPPLALPREGSLYMPAAIALAENLNAAGLLPRKPKPINRVAFGLLDKMKSLDTVIRLPKHLRWYFRNEEISASTLAKEYPQAIADAKENLGELRNDSTRKQWQERNFPDLIEEKNNIDAARAELAKTNPKAQTIRKMSHRSREIETEILDKTLRTVSNYHRTSEMGYWNWRGAILPWSIALGGEDFYRYVIENAKIYEEPFIRHEQ